MGSILSQSFRTLDFLHPEIFEGSLAKSFLAEAFIEARNLGNAQDVEVGTVGAHRPAVEVQDFSGHADILDLAEKADWIQSLNEPVLCVMNHTFIKRLQIISHLRI